MHFVVGTSGHIDHGKTTLVKALTGVDADRFAEEKERGITIDIGFARYRDEEGTDFAFVDVPGGSINGSIETRELVLEKGVFFDGSCKITEP